MLKKTGVVFVALVCISVLLNLGWGIVDVIPDNAPIIGNLDEGAAGALLIWCIQYLFRKSDEPAPPPPAPPKKPDGTIDI